MNLLDLGLDQDLNQRPYKRVMRVAIINIRVVVIYVRVTMIVKL